MASGTIPSKEYMTVCPLGDYLVNSNSYATAGTLPSAYQGARAYVVIADMNGAYMGGGVNSDYAIYLFNNYSVSLTFSGVKVLCFW